MSNRHAFLVIVPLISALAGCVKAEKSSNPLSPSVAGPIPWVNITAPNPLEPRDNFRISVAQQPITLFIGNSTSNSPRPFSYLVEIATDAGFTNKVFVREGVAAAASGATQLRLPDPLAPERTYYWRAMARDGANDSQYSATAFFSVYTPVVFQKPLPQSPIANAQLTSASPVFVFTNASRTGPANTVAYELHVSTSQSFATFNTWMTLEQPGSTTIAAGSMETNTQYYWRVRAFDPNANPPAVGPYSDTQAFRTTSAAPAPAPGPGPSGGSCTGTEEQIVDCRRHQFPGFMSNSQIVQFLRAVARDLNAAGKPFAPNYGILVKTDGTQCNGYSCDIICAGNGGGQQQWDVLIDVQGSQSPVWDHVGSVAVRPCEIQ
jgi:hypothetical protein